MIFEQSCKPSTISCSFLFCPAAIIPGGNVALRDNYISFAGNECSEPICIVEPKEPERLVLLDGDAVIARLSNHYFHFVFESLFRLWPLRIHRVFDLYSNPTIVWYGDNELRSQSREMLKLVWPDFPLNHTIGMGRNDTAIRVKSLSTLIIPRDNQVGMHAQIFVLPSSVA